MALAHGSAGQEWVDETTELLLTDPRVESVLTAYVQQTRGVLDELDQLAGMDGSPEDQLVKGLALRQVLAQCASLGFDGYIHDKIKSLGGRGGL